MPTGEFTGGPASAAVVADSLTGTWLVSVDTANLAPFEVILFKALDDSAGGQLQGFSRIPEFASHMGMNVIRPGPLLVELSERSVSIHGLALGDRRFVLNGSQCGRDLCGALVMDSIGEPFVDLTRASREWDTAFSDSYVAPALGIAPIAGPSFVLRLDDASILDTLSIRLATQLNLPVSLSIPTGLVGDRWRLDWPAIESFADRRGGLPLVHSRTHGRTPSGLLSALNEFAGAKRDFETRDLLPLVFVQPGEWQGAFYLDSVPKLASRYGVMLDYLYFGVQGYVAPAFRASPISRSNLLGRTHWTLDGMTTASVEQAVAAVRSKVGVGLWVWHSKTVGPQVLEYFLRRVASLRDSGVIDVLSAAGEMLARQSLPLWDGLAVSGTDTRLVEVFPAVSGAQCPGAALVSAWDLDLEPGCGLSATVSLVQPGWPVRAIVGWSGDTRLAVRLLAAPSSASGGPILSDSARGTVTRSFGYLVPHMGDRAVTIVVENVGDHTLHISEFQFGLF